MKKHILFALLLGYASLTVKAQHDHSGHQKQAVDTNTKASLTNGYTQQQLPQLLSLYYKIKNALITGDAASASSNALSFVKRVNSIDYKVLSESNIQTLATDAGKIADTKDLKKQRDYFANLSANMIAVAKAMKLTDQPIYQLYCPMKKASWLSSDQAVKNPYYGSSMLTCGQVTDTLQ